MAPINIIKLQFALPCKFSKFGSLTYPTSKQSSDQSGLCIFRGKLLTLNEGLAMAPLLIREQPAVVRLQRNLVSLTQRKPDATVSNSVQRCGTYSHLPWAPDFNTPFLKHHLQATLERRHMGCSAATCLSPVSQPAHDAWYSEQNGEEVERETFSAINARYNL